MTDWIAEAYARPDPNPFIFQVGQMVRLKKGRSDDGQTPEYWDGAIVKVVSMYSTGLLKNHWYKVLHAGQNVTCDFEEDEFDQRYARK
jgi:uncharacterized protein YodC (DUF2158 family)